MAIRLTLGFLLLFGSLALGKCLGLRGILTDALGERWVRWIVKFSSPVVLCLSAWQMDFRDITPWLLPLLGVAVSAATLPPAFFLARVFRLKRAQSGSFITAAFFSNIG